ncbi:hypothetical protein [Rhodoferax aquaticus]|uniref:SRPBCC family protein n=1 Tax=Rhodoferax aquaticus TaxID=2527691 RepID=A0A515ESE9_9BURK|nr:hypothetical protein [Rhodoferax aquaticus]QDL55591.1 hypothetical protein EXZ61_16205 [Rhodoferax aquaticus]
MSITVSIELGYEFEVHEKSKAVFALLSDVPSSASHFPKVHQLTDLGDGCYQWEMEKIGAGQVTLQTVYASRYVSNAAKGTVAWTPVEGVGNAEVSGSWKITNKKTSTKIVLAVQADFHLPLPAIMHAIVAPVVELEFESLTEQYIDSLIACFGGEV